MSATGESPPDEKPAVDSTDNNVEEDPSKDVSDAETEPAMLDEEEMPSYVSLTSLKIPEENRADLEVSQQTERAERDKERASSPYQSEQGADSVCVLSSGEESDRRTCEMPEDYDSEDMDMEDVEEEEEDDEEDDDSCMNDEDEEEEGSDGDIEPEQFERSSDDFVLRYDGGLEKHHKERSRSLQDLTNSRGNLSRFVGKRRSIDLMGSYEPEFSRQTFQRGTDDPLQVRKKMSRSMKYDHVPSKVKLYIQEMKEQRRRSAERNNRQSPLRKNFSDANSRGDNANISRTRLNPANRMIKNYVKNAINEMETNERSKNMDDENYSKARSFDDRAELVAMSKLGEEIREIDVTEKNLSSDVVPENLAITSEIPAKKHKSNGLVDYNECEKIVESPLARETNGQGEIATILNLRSLSYEEYTNGDEASSKPIVENLSLPMIQDNDEIAEYTEEIVVSRPETEIVQRTLVARKEDEKNRQILSNQSSHSRDNWNLRELTFEESSRRKTAQVDREAYQKILEENVSLKQELEEMRKTLEECREENQPREEYQRTLVENTSLKRELKEITKQFEQYRASNLPAETKVASVQTELVNEQKINPTSDESKRTSLANKLLSSSVTSAVSSIEAWSDSNCSPAISIDPPNIENALISDDSLALGDQRPPAVKNLRHLSHSFVTSSRILQTLANFTQGTVRTAVKSPSSANVSRNNSQSSVEQKGQSNKRQAFEPILPINDDANCTSRAKKRKASDMLGLSVNSESFKIPHKPADTRRKISSDSAVDETRKTPDERGGGAKTCEKNEKNVDDSTERRNDDLDDNETADLPKNVKCFVYHDEPNSKERSFLIKADDSTNNVETLDKDGNVRECGPFLLGNVEIRMSEVNGTINIWGKEINQSTEEPEIDADMEVSEPHDTSPYAPRSSIVCQSTPHTKCPNVNASASVFSSCKKTRISPKFSRSGIGKYLRSAATNLTRTNAHGNANNSVNSYNSPLHDNERINDCEHCETHRKRIKFPSCDHTANSRIKQHSCCLRNAEINERDCDCIADNEIYDDSTIFENVSNILANHEKCSNSTNNPTSKRFFANLANEENCSNHQTNRCRRSSVRDDDCHRTKKRCSACSVDETCCGTRLTAEAQNCRAHASHSQSHVSCEDEDHPLLSSEAQCETPETKRRRLSGKKVRGILTDLLRGCGGCREPNSMSNLSRAKFQNLSPKVNPTACSPSQASCSKRTNTCQSQSRRPSNEAVNEKCCNSCNRRAEMEAQMEDQLEIFLAATEQLRSRTDAVLEMLHMMKADTD